MSFKDSTGGMLVNGVLIPLAMVGIAIWFLIQGRADIPLLTSRDGVGFRKTLYELQLTEPVEVWSASIALLGVAVVGVSWGLLANLDQWQHGARPGVALGMVIALAGVLGVIVGLLL